MHVPNGGAGWDLVGRSPPTVKAVVQSTLMDSSCFVLLAGALRHVRDGPLGGFRLHALSTD